MLWMFQRAGQKNPKNKEFQFWQQHNQPILLDTSEKLSQRLGYIHDNPIKAGIVQDAKDYPHCSKYQAVDVTL